MNNIKKVYGPYTRGSDERKVVVIVLNDKSQITKSYPKYLKELELGRELDYDLETVDHKDRDFRNDNYDNLQILTRSENSKKSALRREEQYDNCKWCNINFKLSTSQQRSRTKLKAGPFCSKSCSGKYGSNLQHGNTSKLPNKKIKEPTYYRNDDKK